MTYRVLLALTNLLTGYHAVLYIGSGRWEPWIVFAVGVFVLSLSFLPTSWPSRFLIRMWGLFAGLIGLVKLGLGVMLNLMPEVSPSSAEAADVVFFGLALANFVLGGAIVFRRMRPA